MSNIATFKPVGKSGGGKPVSLNKYSSNSGGEYIIGMPRLKNVPIGTIGPMSMSLINDSLPVMEIVPSFHEFSTKGAETFKMKDGMDNDQTKELLSYKNELEKNYGIILPKEQKRVKVAFQANSNFSDSFSNDFGESSLSKLTGGMSGLMGEFKFATGATTLANMANKIKGMAGKDMAGRAGKFLDKVKSRAKEVTGATDKQANVASGVVNTAMNALVNRINIPLFWTGSTWSPSYSISVRLYNPYPADDEAYAAFILAPLAMLLMFVVPRTTDGTTYFWPWMCQYEIPGLAGLKHGYMRSINVSKGGDVNSISLLQRPVIVDLKIDMGALHTTMISNNLDGSATSSLVEYLEVLKGKKIWDDTSSQGSSEDTIPMGSGIGWGTDAQRAAGQAERRLSPRMADAQSGKRPGWAGEGSAPPSPAATPEKVEKAKAVSTPTADGTEVNDTLHDAQYTADGLILVGVPPSQRR